MTFTHNLNIDDPTKYKVCIFTKINKAQYGYSVGDILEWPPLFNDSNATYGYYGHVTVLRTNTLLYAASYNVSPPRCNVNLVSGGNSNSNLTDQYTKFQIRYR